MFETPHNGTCVQRWPLRDLASANLPARIGGHLRGRLAWFRVLLAMHSVYWTRRRTHWSERTSIRSHREDGNRDRARRRTGGKTCVVCGRPLSLKCSILSVSIRICLCSLDTSKFLGDKVMPEGNVVLGASESMDKSMLHIKRSLPPFFYKCNVK